MQTPEILRMLGQTGAQMPQLGQIKQMVGMLRSAGDPQALLRQMMQQNNPAMVRALDYIKQCGNDPKAAFEKLAAEKGISPADLGL